MQRHQLCISALSKRQAFSLYPSVRRISSSSIKKAATISSTHTTTPSSPEQQNEFQQHNNHTIVDSTKSPQFLKSLPALDLFSYTAIAGMTASPLLIKTATKAMQYTPNFLIKKFVYPIYCGGETFQEVVDTGAKLYKRGFGNMMISYSVEDAEGGAQDSNVLLNNAVNEIMASIDQILVQHYDNIHNQYENGTVDRAPISGYVALKPTGLMPKSATILKEYNNPAYADLWNQYLDKCREICKYAAEHGQGKVVIVFDAEKKFLQPGVYEAQRVMMREFNKDGKVIVAGTIQMYLQDSLDQLKSDLKDAAEHGYQLALKLVRGAYVHSEPDRWNVIHKTKEDTDNSYNSGVSLMLDHIIKGWETGKQSIVGRVIVASHNEESMSLVDQKLAKYKDIVKSRDESVVFGQLMGMAEDQGEELSKRGHKVIKYVPWGPTKETKEYLVRRLEENGDTVNVGGWKMVGYGLNEMKRRMLSKVGL